MTEDQSEVSFKSLGLADELCTVCEQLGWDLPTKIQKEAIPVVLKGQDVIGLAETGSGKTATFSLPILQALMSYNRHHLPFAVVLSPTRELAMQIKESFDPFARKINVRCSVVVGGMKKSEQAKELKRQKPHIIVATPGRLVDLLENTKSIRLAHVKYLVMDEADKMLDALFRPHIDTIMGLVPKDRITMLFSATMTTELSNLRRAHLKNPVRVKAFSPFQTATKLKSYMIYSPEQYKKAFLTHIIRNIGSNYSIIVFCNSFRTATPLAFTLSQMGIAAIPLHGHMRQDRREVALKRLRDQERNVVIATDVAARGLDFMVDYVINYDLPVGSKDYLHRVGRTARAGRGGCAITMVSESEAQLYLALEKFFDMKLPEYAVDKSDILKIHPDVLQSEKDAKEKFKELQKDRTEKTKKRQKHKSEKANKRAKISN